MSRFYIKLISLINFKLISLIVECVSGVDGEVYTIMNVRISYAVLY